ncbi:MAG: AAA family ATPase [Candidatus Saccharimonas sp.]|nr:AAA family ATPase [Planctomycetaceae bacterium]
MSTFESIHIQGFRRLVDVKIELRPLMVMIGANGCGKTSVLEAWQLLAKSAEGKLGDTISSLGGLSEIATRSRVATKSPQRLSLEVRFRAPTEGPKCFEKFDYLLRIANSQFGFQIEQEQSKTNLDHVDPLYNRDPESHLSRTRSGKGRFLRDTLASVTFARPFDLGQVRQPQSVRPATLPGEQGETLISCLYSLRETERDRFEVVEDTLRAAFPDFERLEFPSVAAGMLILGWKDRQFAQSIYMNQLSEGTLRFLWLTALLLSRDLPAVTLIDEPEVSLHPELLSLLVSLMREASQRTQLIVATHSDRLIQFLEPKEVLVADVEDGAAKFTWGDELDIEHWLENYTLDQLWQMGRLGGRAS